MSDGPKIILDPVEKLTKELKKAAALLSPNEVRYLVDGYYQLQDYRKATANQILALEKSGEPIHPMILWLVKQTEILERQIRAALDTWTKEQTICRWARSIVGIGPVISAGLAAHINIHKADTVGHIWRFAGLDPTSEWLPKTKRPWNASLKTLCWKIGESFVKVSNLEDDDYGKVYQKRKVYEQAMSDSGRLKEQADRGAKRVDKSTEAYTYYIRGVLPPGHIHARAKRYAVKLFLAHYHHVAHCLEFGVPPRKLYIMDKDPKHTHFIAPPKWPMKEESVQEPEKKPKSTKPSESSNEPE